MLDVDEMKFIYHSNKIFGLWSNKLQELLQSNSTCILVFFGSPAVADPGFAIGGANAVFDNFFCRKLHENDRKLTGGGGHFFVVVP